LNKWITAKYKRSEGILARILSWADKFPTYHYFTSNGYQNYPYGTFKHRCFIGAQQYLVSHSSELFERLDEWIANSEKYVVGYFGYDLKNDLYGQLYRRPQTNKEPPFLFYSPEIIIDIEEESILISTENDPSVYWNEILKENELYPSKCHFDLKPTTKKSEYIQNVKAIKEQIAEGEFYEMNYCLEFLQKIDSFHPISSFIALNAASKNSFSCLQKHNSHYTLCFSPERFLKRSGDKLISQPIKGTIRKGRTPRENNSLKKQLKDSEKERAENLMIVDLVRNDLNRSSVTGSVKVEELFGIYTFEKVNQMISTVTGHISPLVTSAQSIKNAFPMGSMTGAPKIRVMEEIEKREDFRRSIFSGSIGYFEPNGDFDFNVVIR